MKIIGKILKICITFLKMVLEYNIRAKETLLSTLIDFEMTNVMYLQTTHKIWKKLETLYEGDSHVKNVKLQSLKGKYELLKMGEDENITFFLSKVNELMCNIRCVGWVLEESEIVAKVLRSLPLACKHKVATIEEIWTMTNVTRDMLIGKLAAFEWSDFGDSLPNIESAFKAPISGKWRYDPRERSSRRVSRYEKEMKEMEEE